VKTSNWKFRVCDTVWPLTSRALIACRKSLVEDARDGREQEARAARSDASETSSR
jgi:hypothetical protein